MSLILIIDAITTDFLVERRGFFRLFRKANKYLLEKLPYFDQLPVFTQKTLAVMLMCP